ncbi:MAG: tyrosine-protein phosphatase [Rhodobacteraceae bacterium]|nr:tyrosine-protein phosphatase [Paracoccaceae bacterium]
MKLWQQANDAVNRAMWAWGRDISTPSKRALAVLHSNLVDHAFVRVLWTNTREIAPGVWRSNQPSPRRLRKLAGQGLRTVISLRGHSDHSYMLFEREVCEELGLNFHVAPLGAGQLYPAEMVLDLLKLFDTVERPMLFHCKSGADRTSLAAALYLLHAENAPTELALAEFKLSHLHFKNGPKGVLQVMIKAYGEARAATGISLRNWLETEYDPAALTARWTSGER